MAAALVGLAFYLSVAGVKSLDPTNIGWLRDGDWEQHFIGWTLFRNEPWAFPLGLIRGAMYPLGTTVGFMDAIPWVAVLLKPFAAWLPEQFQYIGPWLASCFMLQGFIGAKLTRELAPGALQEALGGSIFATSWVLLWRLPHEALCAQWLLLGLLWIYVAGASTDSVRSRVGATLALCVISAGVHPYLMVMALGLALAVLVRFWWADKALNGRTFAVSLALVLAATGLTLVLFGYVGGGTSLGWGGFGVFSSDLLTLVNPSWWTRSLPQWGMGPGQYEGYGYIGLSGLLLLVTGAAFAAWHRGVPGGLRASVVVPVLVVCLLMGVFAVSPIVTLEGKPLLDVTRLYAPLEGLTRALRANGRFIWPLHYLLLVAAIALVTRFLARRPWALRAVLAGALLLHVLDLTPTGMRERFVYRAWPKVRSETWNLARGDYKHLALYPPQVIFEGSPCEGTDAHRYVHWSYVAFQQGLTINSGRPARITPAGGLTLCQRIQEDVRERRFSSDTVYVVVEPTFRESLRGSDGRVVCAELDGSLVCVDAARATPLRERLQALGGAVRDVAEAPTEG